MNLKKDLEVLACVVPFCDSVNISIILGIKLKSKTQSLVVEIVKVYHAIKEMIKNRTSLLDLSYELGFCDLSHFTRVFKRIVGTTPAFFMKENNPITELYQGKI